MTGEWSHITLNFRIKVSWQLIDTVTASYIASLQYWRYGHKLGWLQAYNGSVHGYFKLEISSTYRCGVVWWGYLSQQKGSLKGDLSKNTLHAGPDHAVLPLSTACLRTNLLLPNTSFHCQVCLQPQRYFKGKTTTFYFSLQWFCLNNLKATVLTWWLKKTAYIGFLFPVWTSQKHPSTCLAESGGKKFWWVPFPERKRYGRRLTLSPTRGLGGRNWTDTTPLSPWELIGDLLSTQWEMLLTVFIPVRTVVETKSTRLGWLSTSGQSANCWWLLSIRFFL